jgi:drug/metabolite transporter (DMT)-like permease
VARVALVFLAGIVGISFAAIFVRLALPAPPVVTGFYRMLFASAAMAAWALVARAARSAGRSSGGARPGRAEPVGPRSPRAGLEPRAALFALASGVCFGTDLAMWHVSIVRTSVATATLLVNTTPIYVGLYARLVLGERLPLRFVAGAGLALAGAALLLGISRHDLGQTQGALLALAAALFYTGYLLFMKAAPPRAAAAPALLLSNLGATAVLGVFALAAGGPFGGFPAGSWAAIAGATAVSQLGGVYAIVWALRYLPTTVASVALLAQPVGTALLGWWILGEALTAAQAAGGAAVLLGIALASQAGGTGWAGDAETR